MVVVCDNKSIFGYDFSSCVVGILYTASSHLFVHVQGIPLLALRVLLFFGCKEMTFCFLYREIERGRSDIRSEKQSSIQTCSFLLATVKNFRESEEMRETRETREGEAR